MPAISTGFPRGAWGAADTIGAILIARGKKHEQKAPRLAIVPLQAVGTESDSITILEFPKDVQTMVQGPQGTTIPNPALLMVPRTVRFSSIRALYTLLVPGAIHPMMGATVCARFMMRAGEEICMAEATTVNYQTQEVLVNTTVKSASEAPPNLFRTTQMTLAQLLLLLDVPLTGFRDMTNTAFRSPVDEYPGGGLPAPGSNPMPTGFNGFALLFPAPPARLLAPGTNVPIFAPPPPPPGPPPFAAPAQNMSGNGSSGGKIIVDLSGDASSVLPATYLRLLLGNLQGFANADWSKIDASHAATTLGSMMQRLKPNLPFVSLDAANRWFKAKNANLSLMWTEEVLKRAQDASENPEERMQLLRPHAIGANTPGEDPRERRPPDHARAGKTPRGGGEAPEGGHGTGGPHRGGGLFPGVHAAGDSAPNVVDASDDSDNDSEEEAASHKNKKKKVKRGADDEDFPTLLSLTPDDTTVGAFAAMLQETAAGKASATQTIVEAIKGAGLNPRLSWGDDPRTIAEAALVVARTGITKHGGTWPEKPSDKSKIEKVLNIVLTELHSLNAEGASGTKGSGDGGGGMGGAGSHAGIVLSHLAANRPSDDFERQMANSAQVGANVLARLERPSAGLKMWLARVRAAEAGEVAEGAPNDILRLMMADKATRVEAELHLTADTRECFKQDAAAREGAVRKEIERALRARLAPALAKKLVQTIMTFHFSKMPNLREIAAAATVNGGDARRRTRNGPFVGARATRLLRSDSTLVRRLDGQLGRTPLSMPCASSECCSLQLDFERRTRQHANQ